MVVQSTSSLKKRPKSPLDSKASPYSRNTRSVVSADMASRLIEPVDETADGSTVANTGTDGAVDQRLSSRHGGLRRQQHCPGETTVTPAVHRRPSPCCRPRQRRSRCRAYPAGTPTPPDAAALCLSVSSSMTNSWG